MDFWMMVFRAMIIDLPSTDTRQTLQGPWETVTEEQQSTKDETTVRQQLVHIKSGVGTRRHEAKATTLQSV